ncbi:MAG: 50S ribosome-binding GTPase, partial [Deltaproteobacteria bacterium]|nr:50S ribosome-binding GTPase [Deltaproteobacteria bacterium]
GTLPSAIAVMRLSGMRAFEIAGKIFSSESGAELLRVRGMIYGAIRSKGGEVIDRPLLLTFVGPHSFTGEDTIEFQCHGSVAVIGALADLLSVHSARQARPGEFSYRAFLNGKLTTQELVGLGEVYKVREGRDLPRVWSRESDLVVRSIDRLRNHLITLQAILDTAVDFSEEYPAAISQAIEPLNLVIHDCSDLITHYDKVLGGAACPRIVLFGRPNAGKSSLFNALLGRYRAIVHSDPGTTRDVIEHEIWVEKRPWMLADTAGLREIPGSEAESEGIELAKASLAGASVRVLVVDGTCEDAPTPQSLREADLLVISKSDAERWKNRFHGQGIPSSARTGEGLDVLWGALQKICKRTTDEGTQPLLSSVQASKLRIALAELEALRSDVSNTIPPEYLSERGRRCGFLIDAVATPISQEEVFDLIFSEFCIGK